MSEPTRRAVAAGLAAGLAAPALAAPPPVAEAHAPRRIVSLNPCLDVILVQVADRAQIAALCHYSRDPATSSIPELARTFPVTYESAEEVVALRPDLVLTGRHSSAATRAALARMGVQAELFSVPATVSESLDQVRRMAEVVGHLERGEALARRIQAAVDAAAPRPGDRPLSALVFQSNGFASAEGTLVDEMLRRTGFTNAAARYGLKMTSNVPLERLVADPPDVLLAGVPAPGAPNWADRVIEHPALKGVASRMYRATFPQRLMYCGGPVLMDTARVLADARRAALRRRA